MALDDLSLMDDGSAAFLSALAHEVSAQRLLLVVTLDADSVTHLRPATRALRQTAKRITLKALTSDETYALLRSMFGETKHVRSLAERLHRVAAGSPGQCVDLVEQLVARQAISYVGGTWVLPPEVPAEWLSTSRRDVLAGRVERLPEHALKLGRALSLRSGLLPLELCVALAPDDPAQTHAALDLLVREGVLTGSEQGYRFKYEALRAMLHAQIDGDEEQVLHRRLGEALLSAPSTGTVERLKAGVHLLKGGDEKRASGIIALAAEALANEDHDNLAQSVPALEDAVACLGAAGKSDRELVCVLAALSTAAYFFDHRLARYGDRAVAVLEEIVGLALARKLRPYFGRTLGLLLALGCAALVLWFSRRHPCRPGFKSAMQLLFHSVASVAGVHATCLSSPQVARCAATLEPFAVLGRDNGAALMHELMRGLQLTCEDRPAAASAHFRQLVARLDDPRPIRDLPDYQRLHVLGASLLAWGTQHSYQDGAGALEIARRLEGLELKLFTMGAEQIRSFWYGHQGNLALSAEHRDRAEMCAIQLGTSWQIETWGPAANTAVAARTRDALAAKQALEQQSWLSREMPSLELYVQRTAGIYLLLRKKYVEAAAQLEQSNDVEPLLAIGWAVHQGALARVYNELEPERALALCKRTMDLLTPEDLNYPAITLSPQIELARAESGLGEHALAAGRLDALLETHRPAAGPLTLGLLHEARALVAGNARDLESYRLHVAEMERWFRPTRIPSLLEVCERMRESATAREADEGAPSSSLKPATDSRVLEALLGEHATSFERVEAALQYLANAAGATESHLFSSGNGALEHVGSVGGAAPPAPVLRWIGERVEFAEELHSETVVVASTAVDAFPQHSPDIRRFDDRLHHLAILYHGGMRRDQVAGAIVFVSADLVELPQPRSLDIIARLLPGAGLHS